MVLSTPGHISHVFQLVKPIRPEVYQGDINDEKLLPIDHSQLTFADIELFFGVSLPVLP